MPAFLTHTGSFLPGPAIPNDDIPQFLGTLEGEPETRAKILRMNGILTRHYALNPDQSATHDLYDLGVEAARNCLQNVDSSAISYLAAGSTNAPLVAPGIASILHHRLAQEKCLPHSVEISSHSGICTSSAQSLVSAIRAVNSGEHAQALAIGAEQPSDILKSTAITPTDDRHVHDDLRKSKWFMSVFLRSMLSDGAGATVISHTPSTDDISFKVNWTYSRSFAHETELCMKLESRSLLLSQDVNILAQYMKPCVQQLMDGALTTHNDDLSTYHHVLPHLSSFFFKRLMLSVLRKSGGSEINYWTNLQTCGNTGSASIYLMLDEFRHTHDLLPGQKIMLFIPESGQFNFVLISLTVV